MRFYVRPCLNSTTMAAVGELVGKSEEKLTLKTWAIIYSYVVTSIQRITQAAESLGVV